MRVFYYVFGTVVSPCKAMRRLLAEPHRVRLAGEAVGFMGFLYAAVSVGLAAAGAVPLATTFLPLHVENYYILQAVSVIPYVLLLWIVAGGILQGMGRKRRGGAAFADSLALAGAGLAGALFVALIPTAVETGFMALGMGQVEFVEIFSAPGPWQTLYVAMHILAGVMILVLLTVAAWHAYKKTGWIRALAAGLAAAAVLTGAFVLFIR